MIGHEEMESKKRVQQDSIWEILTTEKAYIEDLRIITTVRAIRACLREVVETSTEMSSEMFYHNNTFPWRQPLSSVSYRLFVLRKDVSGQVGMTMKQDKKTYSKIKNLCYVLKFPVVYRNYPSDWALNRLSVKRCWALYNRIIVVIAGHV